MEARLFLNIDRLRTMSEPGFEAIVATIQKVLNCKVDNERNKYMRPHHLGFQTKKSWLEF